MSHSVQEYWHFAQAVAWLAVSRIRLLVAPTHCLEIRNVAPAMGGTRPNVSEQARTAIVRAAARVPWRSDCLVQALAAQSWLSSHGIPCELHIGVRNSKDIAPHAWLTSDGEVVVGGDISDQIELYANGARSR